MSAIDVDLGGPSAQGAARPWQAPTGDVVLRLRASCLALLVALQVLPGLPAHAAEKDGKDQQLRGLQQRLRAADQDKAKLARERSELEAQIKDSADKINQSRRQADAANRQRLALTQELETAAAEKAELADKLAELERRLADSEANAAQLGGRLAQTEGRLARSEAQGAQLGDALALRTQSLNDCSAKNDNLVRVSAHLLGQYPALAQGTGPLLAGEPLTKLARVAVENKVEELRELIDQQQYEPLAARERARRKAALAKVERAGEEQELSEARRAQAAREQQVKARQQSELDKLTNQVKKFFEGIEW
jgi:septal ring factor EnvC (AmiA/AmiB activator)